MGAPKPIADFKEQYERNRQAEIDLIVAEFGGDPARMAEALLYYRHWLRQLVDAGELIRRGEPFAIIGPGPHWKSGQAGQGKQYPWR
jgi:hypothetical protein